MLPRCRTRRRRECHDRGVPLFLWKDANQRVIRVADDPVLHEAGKAVAAGFLLHIDGLVALDDVWEAVISERVAATCGTLGGACRTGSQSN